MARPSSFKPEYCETARSFLGEGYSLAALAGEIGVSRQTLVNWGEEHKEFFDALKDGQAASAKWWERRLRDIVDGGRGNVTAAIFGLKNRARDDWSDRTQTEHTGAVNITVAKDLDGL